MDNSSAPAWGEVVQHLLSRHHNSWLWDAGGVDLDTGQVRAFVAASESGSFGRVAAQLYMSQQALSKRIARLEASLGTLFTRSPGGVTLTARGARFLPDARAVVATADAAVASARGDRNGPLRVDVWGHLHPTYALVQGFAAEHPELVVEVSMRRNLPQSLTAVQRREIDVATGNVAGLPEHLPADLACELVTATPLAALVADRHALAGYSLLDAAALQQHGLWWPSEPGSVELSQFAAEYATFIGAPLVTGGRNMGLSTLIDTVAADPATVTIVSTDWSLPEHSGTRLVPLRPTPYYPWYLIWPRTAAHPLVPALRHSLRAAGRIPDLHAADVWVPAAVDRDGAPSASP